MVGKDPCGQEARHPGTHHDGVGVRPAGASAPATNQSGQPTHLFLPEEDRIEPNVGRIRLHLAEADAGAPVLLLHGWPQHWWCWRRVIGMA